MVRMTGATTVPRATTPLYVTQSQLSQWSGLPAATILRWCKSRSTGFPPPVRVVERTYIFNRREVEGWFRSRQGPGPAAEPESGPTPD